MGNPLHAPHLRLEPLNVKIGRSSLVVTHLGCGTVMEMPYEALLEYDGIGCCDTWLMTREQILDFAATADLDAYLAEHPADERAEIRMIHEAGQIALAEIGRALESQRAV